MILDTVIAHPVAYGLLLAGGVGLGLPMGPAVLAAGALFGGSLGLIVVLAAQVLGLTINWHLCRHWCRGCIVRRIQRRRRWHWLQQACHTPLSWRYLFLLRLSLLPTALVSACCAVSATDWRPYTLASLTLAVRFTMVVQAGAIGADALTGKLSLASTALMLVAAAATAGLAWISSVHLRIHIRQAKV